MSSKKDFKYILSLGAIVNNETLYIKEWIEFHRIVGVTHFYIYDHESTDNLYETVYDYIKQGIVTYTYWPGEAMQMPAYNDCINKYKYESKYIGFIDIDEFIIPVEDKNLVDIIEDIFNRYNNCGGIGLNWRMYGSSNHDIMVDGLVMENYKLRAEDNFNDNKHIKTICNPRVTTEFKYNPHSAEYLKPYHCVNENGIPIKGPFFENSTCDKIRINHYRVKSKEEFILRKMKGNPSKIAPIPNIKTLEKYLLEYDPILNKIYDSITDKYIDELKRRCKLK